VAVCCSILGEIPTFYCRIKTARKNLFHRRIEIHSTRDWAVRVVVEAGAGGHDAEVRNGVPVSFFDCAHVSEYFILRLLEGSSEGTHISLGESAN